MSPKQDDTSLVVEESATPTDQTTQQPSKEQSSGSRPNNDESVEEHKEEEGEGDDNYNNTKEKDIHEEQPSDKNDTKPSSQINDASETTTATKPTTGTKKQVTIVAEEGMTPTTTTPGRVVQFSPYAEIRQINARTEFSARESSLLWWTPHELCSMRPLERDIKLLVNKCGTDCMRGLEIRTPAGYKKRLKNYISAGLAVIDEQEFQQTENFNDPITLATIYGHETRKCRIMAHIKGLMDEAYVNLHVYHRESSEQVKEAIYNRKFASLRMCNCFFNEAKDLSEAKKYQSRRDLLAPGGSNPLLVQLCALFGCRTSSNSSSISRSPNNPASQRQGDNDDEEEENAQRPHRKR